MDVVVLGGSGFVGGAVVEALERRGASVRSVVSPRLRSVHRDVVSLASELTQAPVSDVIADLRRSLSGAAVVVNAAGLATATADGDALFGADALLPGVVAAAVPQGARFVHVSSAAVQGRRLILDETTDVEPFSPYSAAKVLGEQLVLRRGGETVVFRPTSVHGRDRRVTTTLCRVLSSRVASVAGSGDSPTPQVLVGNAGDAIAFVALSPDSPPPVVLQPAEGLSTGDLVRLLGAREPWHVPVPLARAIVGFVSMAGRSSGRIAGIARRLEMMWFGQSQQVGWLAGRWTAPLQREAWKELR